MKTLYPEIEPFDSGMLKVSDIHDIYYERVGNPEGIPVVFLHCGPGGGLIPMYWRFFDPAAYHIILFILQSSCISSTGFGSLLINQLTQLVKVLFDYLIGIYLLSSPPFRHPLLFYVLSML